MVRHVKFPESEVAKLGSLERIQAHYADELHINELLELADQLIELAAHWNETSAEERRKFLDERDAVIAHGDKLAERSPDEVSPLLREDLLRAQADWKRGRAAAVPLG